MVIGCCTELNRRTLEKLRMPALKSALVREITYLHNNNRVNNHEPIKYTMCC